MKRRISVQRVSLPNGNTQIKYVFNFRPDPLEDDPGHEVLGRISFARIACEWAIKEFSHQYKGFKDDLRKRNEWIELALNDSLLTDEERNFIKDLRRITKVRKDNQFRSTIIHAWKALYDYLVSCRKEKPHKAASLVVDLTLELFPANQEIQAWFDTTEVKEINKQLIAAPPSTYPEATITYFKYRK
jgi:hypothetical protein